MIPWIQVYSNLPKHKKIGKLVDALGLKNPFTSPSLLASGLLVGLWTWAAQNALDGDISDCSAQTIAEACGWKKKPDVLVNALIESGFLDADMKLHDWEEYAVLLMESEENRKDKTRERVRRYRDRKRNEMEESPNGRRQSDGGSNVIKAYCSKINATPSDMCLAELEAFSEALGDEVCIRAFDIAIDAKKANWNYIRGILRNAKQRGVTCLADFEALDQKHQEDVNAKKYGKQQFASARIAKDAIDEVQRAAVARLMRDGG